MCSLLFPLFVTFGRFLEVEIEEGGIWRVGLGFRLLWVLVSYGFWSLMGIGMWPDGTWCRLRNENWGLLWVWLEIGSCAIFWPELSMWEGGWASFLCLRRGAEKMNLQRGSISIHLSVSWCRESLLYSPLPTVDSIEQSSVPFPFLCPLRSLPIIWLHLVFASHQVLCCQRRVDTFQTVQLLPLVTGPLLKSSEPHGEGGEEEVVGGVQASELLNCLVSHLSSFEDLEKFKLSYFNTFESLLDWVDITRLLYWL